jgi:L-serine dehydratase
VCFDFEDKDIYQYMEYIFSKMISVIDHGLKQEGKLQAGRNLYVDKVAKAILKNAKKNKDRLERRVSLISAYAYAVGEENASGNFVVTSPTCGSSGVLPSIIYYLYKISKISKKELVFALMSAGLVGNLFKQNATISGAVGGCQAEIGVAVCMATVALCDAYKLNLYQLEYGCELAMEHQLGLTCDPIDGFVVIPCIERNAVGATRAVDAFIFAKCISGNRKNVVNLDDIISTMMLTGNALPESYRETSQGGLAKLNKKN